MSRWCAWCQCYLGTVGMEAGMTHGICDRCAEQQLTAMQHVRAHRPSQGGAVCHELTEGEAQ
jgi:hypothetical protein